MKSVETEGLTLKSDMADKIDRIVRASDRQDRDEFWQKSWADMPVVKKVWLILVLWIPTVLQLINQQKPLSPQAFIEMLGEVLGSSQPDVSEQFIPRDTG